MSRDRDQLMGHASDNDGIEEYDNPLPDWWIGLFIFTIIFGIGYVVEYHFISQRSQASSYQAQLDQAKEMWPNSGKMAAVTDDPAAIQAGAELYAQNCVACHGANLEGGIGPMLTDKVWIHDGTPEGIVNTITNGVVEKGMVAWGPVLGPDKIGKIASFIVSKGGALAPGEASAEPAAAVGTDPAAVVHPEGPDLPAFAPEEITPEMLAAGEELYATNCAVCHKPEMTGLVGPSLVDEEWLHGSDLGDIYRTVTYGVPTKGMISWEPTLGDEKVRQVVGFVYTKTRGEAEASPE